MLIDIWMSLLLRFGHKFYYNISKCKCLLAQKQRTGQFPRQHERFHLARQLADLLSEDLLEPNLARHDGHYFKLVVLSC